MENQKTAGRYAQTLPQVQLVFDTSLAKGVWTKTQDAGALHSIMVVVTEAFDKADKFDALQVGKAEDFRPAEPAVPAAAPAEVPTVPAGPGQAINE